MTSESRDPFEVLQVLGSFHTPNEETVQALHAFGEAALQAVQAIITAMQPFVEAVTACWYSLLADVRRAILAASCANSEISHTRRAMRARKIGRLQRLLEAV